MSPAPFRAYSHDLLGKKIFTGPGHPLRESLKPALRELYEPRIASLEKLLGYEIPEWR
ncbi:MAG: hypothetical protein HY248_05950 [Fimbriimonas ginsengisoli]|nr:hypothetical protein [Fimbriimonas ginsengisoli]